MISCSAAQQALPQYVADGEPTLPAYLDLGAHLENCAQCRAYRDRLRLVEEALARYPLAIPSPELKADILRAVAAESAVEEEWRLLPLSVWLPAATLLLALLALFTLAPVGAWLEQAFAGSGAVGNDWAEAITRWIGTLPAITHSPVFWIVWSGVFAILAGVGLMLSVKSWDQETTQQLNEFENLVGDTAARLLGDWRRAQ